MELKVVHSEDGHFEPEHIFIDDTNLADAVYVKDMHTVAVRYKDYPYKVFNLSVPFMRELLNAVGVHEAEELDRVEEK